MRNGGSFFVLPLSSYSFILLFLYSLILLFLYSLIPLFSYSFILLLSFASCPAGGDGSGGLLIYSNHITVYALFLYFLQFG
ncbi:hypothetical protein SAMN05216383_1071 [Prevotella sp. KH2C16]|nr:hypothetical protein SAMN05216383_1071 [Prevotella sp. KH2C16]